MVNDHDMHCGYVGGKHPQSVGNKFFVHSPNPDDRLNRAAWGS